MNLDGYLGALGQLPTYEQLRANALAMRGEQQRQSLLAQEAPLRIQQQQQELAEKNALRADLMALGDSSSPEQYWKLAARYPTMRGISDAAQALSEAQRRQVVGSASQIHAALQSNRPDLARAIVQRSIDADKASGNPPDPDDLALLGMIDSGDPDQLRAAKGSAYALVAASNPDTAAKNLNDSTEGERDFTLAPGSRRYNARGEIVAEAPFAPQYRSVGEGQTLIEVGGGDPASGTGGGAGSGAPRSVRNNNPGNIVDSAFARSQPGYIGSDGRFARFADQASGQAAQGALLGSYIDRGFNTVGKIINRWAPPNENDTGRYVATVARELGVKPGDVLDRSRIPDLQRAIARVEGGPGSSSAGQAGAAASGGGRVIAQGAPKAQSVRMTAQEVAAEGLDPNTVYYRNKDGVPQAVAGQKKKDSGDQAYSQSALDAFDRAIGTAQRLLRHPGLNAGVGMPSINPFDGNLAGYVVPGSKAADFRTDLDTMKSQVFLPMVQSMKGMGALSNAEGEKLTAAIGNLSTRQSEGSFKASLQRIIKDLSYYKQRGGKAQPRPAASPSGFRILAVRPK